MTGPSQQNYFIKAEIDGSVRALWGCGVLSGLFSDQRVKSPLAKLDQLMKYYKVTHNHAIFRGLTIHHTCHCAVGIHNH